MEEVIRKRLMQREEALREARKFVSCVKRYLKVVTSYLVGSYSRGDFNEWSDIDILIIVKNSFKNPFEKLEAIKECLKDFPRVEPVILTRLEFENKKKKANPLIIEALESGIKLT